MPPALARIARAALLLGTLLGTATGCNRLAGVFACEASDECVKGGDPGVCEPTGFCSFDDPGCPSGRRYTTHASIELAGECVDAIDDAARADGPAIDATPTTCGPAEASYTSPATGHCYTRLDTGAAARPSASSCAALGLVPAILSTPGELPEIVNALLPTTLSTPQPGYHVGLYFDDGAYRHADRVIAAGVPWKVGEPSSSATGDVAFLVKGASGYELDATRETTTGGILCEEPTGGTRGASIYEVFLGHFEPADAQTTCGALGGTLAVITSEAEELYVGGLVPTDAHVMIGLNDRDVEGTYAWPTAEPFAYEDWGGGEPNDASGNSDCTYLVGGPNPSWFDHGCTTTIDGFVCERATP